jgi:hypothetical protein
VSLEWQISNFPLISLLFLTYLLSQKICKLSIGSTSTISSLILWRVFEFNINFVQSYTVSLTVSRRSQHSSLGFMKSMKSGEDLSGPSQVADKSEDGDKFELPLFTFDCLAVATNYFGSSNELGEGGFGLVYKVSFSSIYLFFFFETIILRRYYP